MTPEEREMKVAWTKGTRWSDLSDKTLDEIIEILGGAGPQDSKWKMSENLKKYLEFEQMLKDYHRGTWVGDMDELMDNLDRTWLKLTQEELQFVNSRR